MHGSAIKMIFGHKTNRTINGPQAITQLTSCAEKGYAPSKLALAIFTLNGITDGRGGVIIKKDKEAALKLFEECAENGSIEALMALGKAHEKLKNPELAANWYKKAAEQGVYLAQSRLSGMYSTGNGVEKSDELAAYWLEKANQRSLSELAD